MSPSHAFKTSLITFRGDGVPDPTVVAAVAWDQGDAHEWDLVASQPAVDPILRGHFSWCDALSDEEIRTFVEAGHKGYRMQPPVRREAGTAREAALRALREVRLSR